MSSTWKKDEEEIDASPHCLSACVNKFIVQNSKFEEEACNIPYS